MRRLVVTLAALAVFPASAAAHNDYVDYDGSTLVYGQYPGLIPDQPDNTLSVTYKSDSTGQYFVFKDPASTGITNRDPCIPLDAEDYSVRCPAAGVGSLLIDTRTGNDSVTVNAPTRAEIYAGDGDDGITSGAGATTVFGQAGNDTLVAGAAGGATLDGGTGSDQLRAQNGAVDNVSWCDGVDAPLLVDAFDSVTGACPATDVESPIRVAPWSPPTTPHGGGGSSGGSGAGGGAGGGTGAAALRVRSLRMLPTRFRAASRGASIARAGVGSTVVYGTTAAATTTFRVARRRCARGGRRCRFVVVGRFAHRDRAGQNRFRFTGRLGGRALRPGRYRLTATPRAGGVKGSSASVRFRVVR